MNKSFKALVASLSLLLLFAGDAGALGTYRAISCGAYNHAGIVDLAGRDVPNEVCLGGTTTRAIECFSLGVTQLDPVGVNLKFESPPPVTAGQLLSLNILSHRIGDTGSFFPISPLFVRFCFLNTVTREVIREDRNFDDLPRQQLNFDNNWRGSYEVHLLGTEFRNPAIKPGANLVLTKLQVVLLPYLPRTLYIGRTKINGQDVTDVAAGLDECGEFDSGTCNKVSREFVAKLRREAAKARAKARFNRNSNH